MIAENVVEPGERIVERVHEEPAHQIDDQHVPPADPVQPPAGTRRALREIRRTQQARVAVDIGDELPLVPDVVAGGQDVDAAIVEFAAEALGQAESAGRVLRVDDDEVEREFVAQRRHVLLDGVAARAADHVAAKQDVHGVPFRGLGEWEVRGEAASAVGMQTLRGPP